MRGLFSEHGFMEIETPLLEYFSTVDDKIYGFGEENVWKTFDRRGRVLAIRPDSTIPAVRVAASRLLQSKLPLRLCYMQTVMGYPQEKGAALCESTQAGVELMGESNPMADAEVIALAIESLERAGLREFQIDLGQVAFFKGFMEEAGLDAEQADAFRTLVEEKNSLAMALFLEKNKVPKAVSQRIMALPTLYGDESALDEALAITNNAACREAVDNLRQILDMLDVYEYKKYISIDLGMVHAVNYYSGLIFRGITGHVGQPILSGGRYDALPALYGRDMPATGFGLSLKLLMTALYRQGEEMKSPVPDCVIGVTRETLKDALTIARRLRNAGDTTVLKYTDDREPLADMVRCGEVRRALVIAQGRECCFEEADTQWR